LSIWDKFNTTIKALTTYYTNTLVQHPVLGMEKLANWITPQEHQSPCNVQCQLVSSKGKEDYQRCMEGKFY